jgi:hypothetical protein
MERYAIQVSESGSMLSFLVSKAAYRSLPIMSSGKVTVDGL